MAAILKIVYVSEDIFKDPLICNNHGWYLVENTKKLDNWSINNYLLLVQ